MKIFQLLIVVLLVSKTALFSAYPQIPIEELNEICPFLKDNQEASSNIIFPDYLNLSLPEFEFKDNGCDYLPLLESEHTEDPDDQQTLPPSIIPPHIEKRKKRPLIKVNNAIVKNDLEEEFNCQYCGKKEENRSKLIRHEIVHTKISPFNCSLCNKKFSQKSSISVHLKNIHHQELLIRAQQQNVVPLEETIKYPAIKDRSTQETYHQYKIFLNQFIIEKKSK